ncbi:FecR family protein [Luteimonas sp. SDU82]|uniref:FecR family protein n=1 Tax=Luteimonas sp. SDU82 TaxID=3422592 RepID=UPI003EB912E3
MCRCCHCDRSTHMANTTEIERAASEWLARRESGWSEADQAAFRSWRDASTAHRVAWIRIEAGWQRAARLKALGAGLPTGEVPRPGAWPELPGRHEDDPLPMQAEDLRSVVFRGRVAPTRRPWRWPAVAAILCLAVGISAWWQFGGIERATHVTALGETQRVVLVDGSVVQLSSDSRMEVAYSRGRRGLTLLQGEAFFEVASDPDRPFAVDADSHRVVAVGTQFSVRRGAAGMRVAVTEGRVRLEDSAHAGTPKMLVGGMVAVVDAAGVRLRQSSADELDDLLSWRRGLLVFNGTPLSEAVAEFNRYNAHKLVVADPRIASIPVGGSFRWTNTDAFVRVLEQGFGLRAERGDGETRLRAQ